MRRSQTPLGDGSAAMHAADLGDGLVVLRTYSEYIIYYNINYVDILINEIEKEVTWNLPSNPRAAKISIFGTILHIFSEK